MNKSIFLVLCTVSLLSACNQTQKPAPEVVHETTVIREVEKPKPEPVVKQVEVNSNGVKVNLQDKNGNSFEISKKH